MHDIYGSPTFREPCAEIQARLDALIVAVEAASAEVALNNWRGERGSIQLTGPWTVILKDGPYAMLGVAVRTAKGVRS
jgi:hypothetical protein